MTQELYHDPDIRQKWKKELALRIQLKKIVDFPSTSATQPFPGYDVTQKIHDMFRPVEADQDHSELIDDGFEALRVIGDQNGFIQSLERHGCFRPKRRPQGKRTGEVKFHIGDVISIVQRSPSKEHEEPEKDRLAKQLGVIIGWTMDTEDVTYHVLSSSNNNNNNNLHHEKQDELYTDARMHVSQHEIELLADVSDREIQKVSEHFWICTYFSSVQHNHFIPCSALASRYPDDFNYRVQQVLETSNNVRKKTPSIVEIQTGTEGELLAYLRTCQDESLGHFIQLALLRHAFEAYGEENHVALKQALGCVEMNDVAQAKDILSSIIREVPTWSIPYERLGLILFDEDDYVGALTNFQLAMEHNDQNAEAWGGIAMCRLKLGNPARAFAALLRAVQLHPSSRLGSTLFMKINEQVNYFVPIS